MRRTLVVMRHAKSSWDTGLPDFERPLSRRGAKDAAAAGRILAGYRLGCVLSSTSTRTRQTWAGATNGGAACLDVRFTDALYHAWTDEVLVELGSIPDARPWTKRAASSTSMFGAAPAIASPRANTTKPTIIGCTGPIRSVTWPEATIENVMAMTKAVNVQA